MSNYKLSDICKIRYGKDHKSLDNGNIPVYGTGGIMRYVDSTLYEKESVLIPRKGTLSNLFYVDEPFWTIDTLFYTEIDKSKVLPKYLYFKLKTIDLAGMNVGTAVPSLTTALLNEIELNIPSLENQIKIVDILSSLENKIENNNAIIANLEEQAQTIFKSWFVDFEPFQDGEFIESEIGNIPRNWEVGQLGNSKLGELKSSGIEDFEGEKIYIATADVEGTWINSENTGVTYEDKPSRANMQPTPYSVWFAKMKDSRKLILVDNFDKYLLDNMIFSTGFAGIQCNILSVYYLWEFIKTNYFDEVKNQYSNGTTMQAINNKNINQILVIIPPQIVLSKFNSILHPINNKISLLKRENITLAEARDTLLPKLMSGEIRVEETIEVEEM